MRRRHKGQALIYVGVFLFAFVSFTALVLDGARLYFSARETQAAADTAAIGGMLRLIENGNASDAVAGAEQSANLNTVNGQAAAIDASNIFVGHWSCSPAGNCTPTFAPGLPPYNAVRTTPSYPISNLLPLWQSVSHPRRNATAAWLTLGTGIPGIPIILANCFSCYSTDCSPPPTAINFSAGGTPSSNGAWYYPSSTKGANGVGNYVPSGPCNPLLGRCSSCNGSGQIAPTLNINSSISVTNGGVASVCKDFECLIGNQYLVGVVGTACGAAYVGDHPITGFATVKILGTRCTSKAEDALGDAPVESGSIKVQAKFIDCAKPENASICSSQLTSECPGCGTGQVVMVE